METRLDREERQQAQQLLQDYAPAQDALAALEQHDGDLDASFEALMQSEMGVPRSFAPEGRSLWQVTLKVLRQEVCGDKGFRDRVADYTENPSSTPLLTGLIVYLATLTTLPINPAIATIVVLYILKIGLNIFCEYTEPSEEA